MTGPATFRELVAQVGAANAAQRYDTVAELLVHAARETIYRGWEPEQRTGLAELLKTNQQFGYARRVYNQIYQPPPAGGTDRRLIRQQYALCVYKDTELPASRRFDRALEVLRSAGPSAVWTSEDDGLEGAIHKRRWRVEGRLEDLERSLLSYSAGYARVGDSERDYCGVNAAFVLDQLARLAVSDGSGETLRAADLHSRAEAIRREIASRPRGTLAGDFWSAATFAEALFGLKEFPAAAEVLERVVNSASDWQLETLGSQLAELARVRGFASAAPAGAPDYRQLVGSDAGEVLRLVVGATSALRRAYLGKVGIALSGGGFRASLFHIGLLAALAERDVLRSVEVLSCVSGGSIIGASYYLRLRTLLQDKLDAEITAQHYVDLVQGIAVDFLAAVQRNPRLRLTSRLAGNYRMLRSPKFSRTDRIAEVFDELIFPRVPRTPSDGSVAPWRMPDLLINPRDRPRGFSPRYDNWRREAKVPILVLNATSLNTGHGWQFTASTMGEPPDSVAAQVDANRRLRRGYYSDAPPPYRREPPRLATAVAASACVPGLFPPVALPGLFKDEIVRLVDGGVYDNQGTACLLEQDCGVILLSDASGQMGERADPGRRLFGVALRSNSILGSRVRGAQFADLASRKRGGTVQRLMIVHLKKGLSAPPRDWNDTESGGAAEAYTPAVDEQPASVVGVYEIDESVQRALADLRTDLDAFSDDEAYSLMAAGYAMGRHELEVELPDFPPTDPALVPTAPWPFAAWIALVAAPLSDSPALDAVLRVGDQRFFRPLRRWRRARARKGGGVGKVLGLGVAGVAGSLKVVSVAVRWVGGAPVALVGWAATKVCLKAGAGKDDA